MYHNKDQKEYLKKVLKIRLIGIKSGLEEVNLGEAKININELVDQGKRKLKSGSQNRWVKTG